MANGRKDTRKPLKWYERAGGKKPGSRAFEERPETGGRHGGRGGERGKPPGRGAALRRDEPADGRRPERESARLPRVERGERARPPREAGAKFRPMPEPAREPAFAVAPDLPRENLLVGRNPIREALKSGRDMEKLLVARGELSGSARELVAIARERRIVVQEVDRARLDALAPGHQGMAAFASAFRYATVEDMLTLAGARGEPPLLVVLDGVTDPHNLGAVIRTAECAGAHGVIIPERRAVGLTPAAVKASAGAVEYLPVARVGNIPRLIERLKRQGIWTYAAMTEGEPYDRCDLSGPAALIIGAEGEGVSRLAAEKCDHRVTLPLRGRIASLNASVAAGVLLYETLRRRGAARP